MSNANRNALTDLMNVCLDVYGVGVVYADQTTILWTTARCEDPKLSLKEGNKLRAKYGRPLVYAPYEHPAF